MIWAILIFIGIPLWLIAMILIFLVRTRSKVGSIPGSLRCKVRTSTNKIPGLNTEFARYTSTAHWVHDVLIVHGGTFLIRTLPLGMAGGTSKPMPATENSRTKKFASPVSLRFTHDSGIEIEFVCAASDAAGLLGPFAD
ncbi:MAG: hypothetical protein Q8M73_03395 [Actinomycetota bacterium]|nr:hypothetical protein [Actinomycetota bacterium]